MTEQTRGKIGLVKRKPANDLTGFWCSRPVSIAGLIAALFFGALCFPALWKAMFMEAGH